MCQSGKSVTRAPDAGCWRRSGVPARARRPRDQMRRIVGTSSTLMAIVLDETQAQALIAALEAEEAEKDILISAATVTEALIVSERRNVGEDVAKLVEGLGFEIVDVTPATARRVAPAHSRWGKGIHAAALNFGDCFAYDVAMPAPCSSSATISRKLISRRPCDEHGTVVRWNRSVHHPDTSRHQLENKRDHTRRHDLCHRVEPAPQSVRASPQGSRFGAGILPLRVQANKDDLRISVAEGFLRNSACCARI